LLADTQVERVAYGLYALPGAKIQLPSPSQRVSAPGTLTQRLCEVLEARRDRPLFAREILSILEVPLEKARVARTLLGQLAKEGRISKVGDRVYGIGDATRMRMPETPRLILRREIYDYLQSQAGRGVRTKELREQFPKRDIQRELKVLVHEGRVEQPRDTVFGVRGADGRLDVPGPLRKPGTKLARVVELLRQVPRGALLSPTLSDRLHEDLRARGRETFDARAVAANLGADVDRIRRRLNDLVEKGHLQRRVRGRYRVRRLPAPPSSVPEDVRRRALPFVEIINRLGLKGTIGRWLLHKAMRDGTVVRVAVGWYAASDAATPVC
jgi:hypothetical protein